MSVIKTPPQRFVVSVPSDLSTLSGNITASTSIGSNAVTVKLAPAMVFDAARRYIVRPLNASVPYSAPNIGAAADTIPGYPSGNNRISINWNAGGSTDYFAPAGLYGYTDVASWLNQTAANNGWTTSPTTQLFYFTALEATQKLILNVDPSVLSGTAFPSGGVVIAFTNPSPNSGLNDSMGTFLGWPVTGSGATLTISGSGTAVVSFTAPNRADFSHVNSYVLQTDFCKGSFLNGQNGGTLFNIPLGSYSPNSGIAYSPSLAQDVELSQITLQTMTLYWCDQDGHPLPAFNEPWSVDFHITEA